MNAEKRKALRARVQAHQSIANVRRSIFAAVNKLPDLRPADESTQAKRETLTRRFLGGKMPKRIVLLHRGHYAVRPCISGVVFTVAVFPSLGGRENHKLVAPISRLSDAISYHFRASRMRAHAGYNYDEAQAKVDSEVLRSELEALSKLLVECGVPVAGHTAGHSVLDNDHALSRIVVLEAHIKQLSQENFTALKAHEERIAALETILRRSGTQEREGTVAYPNCNGIPSSF